MTVAMAVMLLLPTTTNAQTKMDGFFTSSSETDAYSDRSNYTGDFSNQSFGQAFGIMGGGSMQQTTVPVGSGLLIMTLAGASYVLFKKKED